LYQTIDEHWFVKSSIKLRVFYNMKKILVTGSSGLIGSEVCVHFANLGWEIHGIDNNQRAIFFGTHGDTRWNQKRLQESLPNFIHHELDIRSREEVIRLIATVRADAIVHTAAQPSHDKAAAIPFDDFDTNAVGTLNLLDEQSLWRCS
jgi:CDP-paratose 2-epimerase